MKKLFFIALAAFAWMFVCFAFGQVATPEGVEPDPWWLHVEKIQDLLMKWIAMISFVLTGIVGAIFTVWALINSKLKEIKERQDRDSLRTTETTKHLQSQVTDIAIQTEPKKNEP